MPKSRRLWVYLNIHMRVKYHNKLSVSSFNVAKEREINRTNPKNLKIFIRPGVLGPQRQ